MPIASTGPKIRTIRSINLSQLLQKRNSYHSLNQPSSQNPAEVLPDWKIMSREQYNDLNKKAYDTTGVSMFDLPELLANARLAAKQFLSYQPIARNQHDNTTYNKVNVGEIRSGFSNVNREIWPKDAKVLDFACGVGSNSREILTEVGKVVGVDISADMISEYKKRVGTDEAYAMDLLSEDQTENDKILGHDFDNAICSMAYHHIPDLRLTTERLASHVKEGGWVFVMDFESGHDHDHSHNHGHDHDHSHNHGHGHDHHHSHSHDQHNHNHGSNEHGAFIDKSQAEKLGVAHTVMTVETTMDAFEKAGLRNVGCVRGFQFDMWIGQPEMQERFFHGKDMSTIPSRVNEEGKTEYQFIMKLAIVVGQKGTAAKSEL